MKVRAIANGEVTERTNEEGRALVASGIYEQVIETADAAAPTSETKPKAEPKPKTAKKATPKKKTPGEYKRRDMQAES